MDTEILEDLGLTRSEIKVFLTSLELGTSSAGPIVEKSGIQNAVVHRCLHSLIEKGLITYLLEGKKRIYQAVDPNVLIDFIDEKKERLNQLLPDLLARQNTRGKPKAEIFVGKRGVREMLHKLLDTDAKTYVAYGGGQDSQEILGGHFWTSFHKKRREKKIDARLIFHQSLKWWGKKLAEKKYTQLRITDKEFEELTETFICGNLVALVIFVEKPYGFLIDEPLAAKAYMKYFDILWKAANPV